MRIYAAFHQIFKSKIIKSKNGRRKAAVFGFRSFEINVKNVDCNFNKP